MSELQRMINDLPEPALPAYFSAQEKETVLSSLMLARKLACPYEGAFTAEWLLSPFESHWWLIKTSKSYQRKHGDWVNVMKIQWDIALPDGTMLTDSVHCKLLDTSKKIAFLLRSGIVRGITSSSKLTTVFAGILLFTRWIILHRDRYQPDKFAFSMLDQSGVESLFAALVEGGWAIALDVPKRILRKVYQLKYELPCPHLTLENPYRLPPDVVNSMIDWFETNRFYRKVPTGIHYNKRYIGRTSVAALIGEPEQSIFVNQKINAFLRQFEPDFGYSELLLSIREPTEYPSHKTKTLLSAISDPFTEHSLLGSRNTMTAILSTHRHLPESLPDPSLISVHTATSRVISDARPSLHTPFIPVEIALSYMNNAIKFVHVFGEAIVDLYIAVMEIFHNSDKISQASQTDLNAVLSKINKFNFLISLGFTSQPLTEALNIKYFSSRSEKLEFDRLRSAPTLHQMVYVLIGACIVCIGIMKPSREVELTDLKRDCLRKDGDGYLLKHEIAKSGVNDLRKDITRPIPFITANAIKLMQKLSQCFSGLFPDSDDRQDKLFFFPRIDASGTANKSDSAFSKALDIFCDYVALPPDTLGRRWYVRVHEMRKWFLLMLFWSGRFDVLDAARWIAGHSDASHIFAYIEKNFPGEELPQIEAEYAVARLLDFETGHSSPDTPSHTGLSNLYREVLRHFDVQSLSMIPDSEWMGYVVALREAEGFVLEPHSIRAADSDEIVGMNVSFVFREIPQ